MISMLFLLTISLAVPCLAEKIEKQLGRVDDHGVHDVHQDEHCRHCVSIPVFFRPAAVLV
jgi:hypothetical protein